ncbi:MAG: hypothetical protein EOQ50_00475 [Mesorhizobium sp.]|uniref:hypothetical protein n=1 Tax=Mesorhizobium sp. TaxID=1871066 RepID=UPI000FE7214A|nr:hypothetical protein [Mesorhizobium sp.]RWB78332.1 MAG: hypothetical protein EOQ50_00475 [Mesorhizobium sp.]
MSTSETVDIALGPCPCSQGKLFKYVTSQDNPWSSVQISYGTDCQRCSNEWSFSSYGTMTNNASEQSYKEAYEAELEISTRLLAIVDDLVDAHFADYATKPATVELREMHRLGIAKLNIEHLRKARRAGRKPSETVSALNNLDWLYTVARRAGREPEFIGLRKAYEDARAETKRRSEKIVRRSIA